MGLRWTPGHRRNIEDRRNDVPAVREHADAVDGRRMTERQIKAQLADVQALALTLWAEARGEPIEGLVGVGWVIKNRLAHPARYRAAEKSYRGIVFAPKQFSCWNTGTDANHVRLMAMAERLLAGENITEPAWLECAWVAVGIVEDRLRDRTHGASHYLTSALYRDVSITHWARRLLFIASLGSHVFLTEPSKPSLRA